MIVDDKNDGWIYVVIVFNFLRIMINNICNKVVNI